ncbi:MAG TPA: AmmeMemoRadiSam system protein B [Candidatus Glassbacteria bacterium]|nr:AmmeMemoRadiSam system protein B [Candidatus Glassbacteria bacterium]
MKITDNLGSKIRYPTQSGSFYQSTEESLKKQIEYCFLHELGPKKIPALNKNGPCNIIGLVSPHAGFMYSGPIAAHAYYALASDCIPETVVILGPNHTGYGSGISLMNDGFWQTPMGNVEIDSKIANLIVKKSKIVDIDEIAHRFEHSIEVQLPFLQYIYGSNFKFVPICFQMQDLNSILEIGKTLAEVFLTKKIVIIASSDMNHYQPQKITVEKDIEAIQAIEELNENRFYSLIETKNISACGYGPIATMITTAKKLGGKKAELLSHITSGDITGDLSSVVGYAAMTFRK